MSPGRRCAANPPATPKLKTPCRGRPCDFASLHGARQAGLDLCGRTAADNGEVAADIGDAALGLHADDNGDARVDGRLRDARREQGCAGKGRRGEEPDRRSSCAGPEGAAHSAAQRFTSLPERTKVQSPALRGSGGKSPCSDSWAVHKTVISIKQGSIESTQLCGRLSLVLDYPSKNWANPLRSSKGRRPSPSGSRLRWSQAGRSGSSRPPARGCAIAFSRRRTQGVLPGRGCESGALFLDDLPSRQGRFDARDRLNLAPDQLAPDPRADVARNRSAALIVTDRRSVKPNSHSRRAADDAGQQGQVFWRGIGEMRVDDGAEFDRRRRGRAKARRRPAGSRRA